MPRRKPRISFFFIFQKRNIFKSLPNSRLESKSDSMAYNRVSTHLAAFKKAVVDQVRPLTLNLFFAGCLFVKKSLNCQGGKSMTP